MRFWWGGRLSTAVLLDAARAREGRLRWTYAFYGVTFGGFGLGAIRRTMVATPTPTPQTDGGGS